jgi:hypothetical protein
MHAANLFNACLKTGFGLGELRGAGVAGLPAGLDGEPPPWLWVVAVELVELGTSLEAELALALEEPPQAARVRQPASSSNEMIIAGVRRRYAERRCIDVVH